MTMDKRKNGESKKEPSSNKTQDEEDRIRERLKQRQEARRRESETSVNGGTKSTSKSARNSSSSPRNSSPRNASPRNSSPRNASPRPPPSRKRDNRHHRGGPRRDEPPPRRYGHGPPPGRHPRDYRGPPPDWRGPPEWRGRGPPPDWRGPPDRDPYGRRMRGPPPPHYHRGRSPPRRGRSYSPSSGSSDDDSRSSFSSSSSRSRSRSRHRRSPSYSSSSSSSRSPSPRRNTEEYALTKDQRTVFCSQLVMRTTARDLSKWFRRNVGKVNDVQLLKDKRTGRHKGIAYVELANLEDVVKAIQMNGQVPDFQRFPILIKQSEAEKNYVAGTTVAGPSVPTGPILGPDGKLYESQKVYVGNLDMAVTSEHLYKIFMHFGQLEKVSLQMEMGISKGFAFLSFRDPKEANLAIQAMAGKSFMGRQLKTGWASQTSTTPNVETRTSDEFPENATARIQNANVAMAQILHGGFAAEADSITVPVSSAAEAALDAAFGPAAVTPSSAAATAAPTTTNSPETEATAAAATSPNKQVTGTPSCHILVHNMFDKDLETEDGWVEDIRLDFEEECSKYGKIVSVLVKDKEPGGKIYASFETVDGAKTCASSLAGRWFDKRQLRVEYVEEIPQE